MTLDGFLTFLTLLAAIYALMTPIARLRINLGGLAIQVPLAIFSFAIVLYLQFDQPCPARLRETCNWLVIKPGGPITPSQASFLIVLAWMISAWIIYKSNVSQAKAGTLPTLSRLVDNLIYEQRFAEALMLVEHYLPLIGQAARRRLRMQKVHDHLSRLKNDNLMLHYLVYDKKAFEREQVRSPLSKTLWRWVGYLELFVPNQNKAENAAKDIVRILFQSEDIRRFITTMRQSRYYRLSTYLQLACARSSSRTPLSGPLHRDPQARLSVLSMWLAAFCLPDACAKAVGHGSIILLDHVKQLKANYVNLPVKS